MRWGFGSTYRSDRGGRIMARARNWERLSDTYRKRLINAGVTRSAYESGVSLRKARGHGFKGPTNQAPAEATRRVSAGSGSSGDVQSLRAWRDRGDYPAWIPRDRADMDDTTAAILSTIRPLPDARDRLGRRNGWRSVSATYRNDGTVLITIQPIRGYAFEVELPDSDSASQFFAAVSNLNTPGIRVDKVGYPRPVKKARPKKKTTKKKKNLRG